MPSLLLISVKMSKPFPAGDIVAFTSYHVGKHGRVAGQALEKIAKHGPSVSFHHLQNAYSLTPTFTASNGTGIAYDLSNHNGLGTR